MTNKIRAIDVAWPQDTWRQWVRELQAENAALREIVQAVANAEPIGDTRLLFKSEAYLLHDKARALLASEE